MFKKILIVSSLLFSFAIAFPAQALYMPGYEQATSVEGNVLGAATLKYDINGDGIVNVFDAAIIINHIGQNYPQADLNGDGTVNSLDLSLLSSVWFATVPGK